MRCEWPEFKRCCLCLPLRRGLLGIAYLKVLMDLFISSITITNLAHRAKYYQNWLDVWAVLLCLTASYFILDMIFHVLIIVGAHMKNPKFLSIFFRCAIFMLVLDIVFPILSIVTDMVIVHLDGLFIMMLPSFVFLLMLFCANLLVHIYMTSLVRCEILKLKNNAEYEFTNRTETLRDVTSELQEV